ncbi:MAG: ABC transporter ATP-binding protein [Kiloniellales bacterium]
MAAVELSGVTKKFGDVVAVDSVDLKIEDGEFMVFVGPSGCGKSTTLRMVAGLEDTSSGTIQIGARDVTHMEPKDRNVAMVFQNYALYAHKNVYQNLGFGLKVRGTPRAETDQRVRRAAAMLGIEDLLARKPKQLSGGQKQRVALGRALVRDPEIFLLDEPLSNLDARMRVRMREEIAKLHAATGSSMLYVTHDQIEAMTLGDRIAVMNKGRVQQVGPPLELYDRPANVFVAGFIGSPEINLIDGALAQQDGSLTIACGDFSLPLRQGAISDRAASQGAAVRAGIRPEHISVAAEGGGVFSAEIELVEQMGAQTLLVCKAGATRLRALLDRNDRVRVADRIPLKVEAANVHVFESQSGDSLLSG